MSKDKKPETKDDRSKISVPVTLPEQKGLRTFEDSEFALRVLRKRKFDDDGKVRALDALANLGTVANAAKAAGVCTQTIRDALKEDKFFAKCWEEALGDFRDKMEMAAYTRAVDGWEEPVYSQKLGVQIGTVKKYDSGLLQFIMKRWIPDYREKVQADVNIKGGVLILAAARATSYEEVFARHGDKTYTPTSEIIDVESSKEEE